MLANILWVQMGDCCGLLTTNKGPMAREHQFKKKVEHYTSREGRDCLFSNEMKCSYAV